MRKTALLINVLIVVFLLPGTLTLAQQGAQDDRMIGTNDILQAERVADADLGTFGVSTGTFDSFSSWGPKMHAAGVEWLRGFPEFADIEPVEGTWNWTDVDDELRTAETNHLKVSGLFIYNAPWINSDLETFPTDNLPAWSTYISNTVKHVGGKIKYWEVWNEAPNFADNDPTPGGYASMMRTAYPVTHAANPHANVGMVAGAVDINWLDQVLLAGATDNFDYITLHPYDVLASVDSGNYGWEAEFMSIVPTVRKMLASRNPAKLNVPIVFSEIGESIDDNVTPEIQAGDLVKAYTMGIAQGVATVDWFEAQDDCCGEMGLLDANGKPRPDYTAMSVLTKLLGAHAQYIGWVLLNGRDYGFVFQGINTTILATWARPGTRDAVNFWQTVQVMNPITGNSTQRSAYTLTNIPVLILGVPEQILDQAKLNRDQPFPWGGDFTNAKSVHVGLGAINTDEGLHQLGADTSSAGVTYYGSPARFCGANAVQVFAVDPNFLSYTTVPIKVTAVVRGDAANDSAGFVLMYESTSGLKGTGTWNNVPDNSQWYTITWIIDDAQFVGKWGYNIRLDSGSTQYSQYYIQSLTVEKM